MPSGGSHLKKAQAVRNQVSALLALGMNNQEISAASHVSSSFVTQQRHRDEAKALGLDEYMATRGRPRAIQGAALQTVADFLSDFPTAYRDEICDLLADEHGLFLDVTTVGKWLKHMKTTHKRVSKINIRRDEDLVNEFLATMTRFSAEQIVALDESAANERTSDRKYGWAPRGQPCRIR